MYGYLQTNEEAYMKTMEDKYSQLEEYSEDFDMSVIVKSTLMKMLMENIVKKIMRIYMQYMIYSII